MRYLLFLCFLKLSRIMPQRLIAIDAPCRSASLHGKAQRTLVSLDTGAALVPTALRLPPPIILRGFAAYLPVSKACTGSNATCVHSPS